MKIEVTDAMLDELGAFMFIDMAHANMNRRLRYSEGLCEAQAAILARMETLCTLGIPVKSVKNAENFFTAVKIGDKEYPVNVDPRRWESKPESEVAP